jgi:hypothetical protein
VRRAVELKSNSETARSTKGYEAYRLVAIVTHVITSNPLKGE